MYNKCKIYLYMWFVHSIVLFFERRTLGKQNWPNTIFIDLTDFDKKCHIEFEVWAVLILWSIEFLAFYPLELHVIAPVLIINVVESRD